MSEHQQNADLAARRVTVARTDFKRRSRVHLSCSECGGTTFHVPKSEADLYEQGLREHTCGVMTPLDVAQRRSARSPAASATRQPIRTADGIDITEAVQILYDIAHSSMDWGSGFLDNEEMETVIRLAVTMGWQVPDLPDNSPPMVSVAKKFPSHYEVSVVHIQPNEYFPEGHDRPKIIRRTTTIGGSE